MMKRKKIEELKNELYAMHNTIFSLFMLLYNSRACYFLDCLN